MLRLRRFAWYLVGGADLSPFFTYSDDPSTISVRADVDWSGDAMTCKSTSAGAVELESHEIEAWSMIQKMVLLSSAESEFDAVDAPMETLGRRRKQDRRTDANPETRAEDVADQTIQAVEKVPDTIDSTNKEAKQSARIVNAEGRDCSRE